MVRDQQQMQTEVREHMRGGQGSVTICHLEKEGLPGSARLFARLVLPVGASIGAHEHTGETELFCFVSGEGVVTDDGERVPVKAGDSMTTRAGHSHSVENTGREDLVIIAAIILE